jgi:hypothetical protein
MSTFAQQTTRSRHTSSSSIQSPTTVDGQPTTTQRSFASQSRTGQSRERTLSALSATTTRSNTTPIISANSTLTDQSMFIHHCPNLRHEQFHSKLKSFFFLFF